MHLKSVLFSILLRRPSDKPLTHSPQIVLNPSHFLTHINGLCFTNAWLSQCNLQLSQAINPLLEPKMLIWGRLDPRNILRGEKNNPRAKYLCLVYFDYLLIVRRLLALDYLAQLTYQAMISNQAWTIVPCEFFFSLIVCVCVWSAGNQQFSRGDLESTSWNASFYVG